MAFGTSSSFSRSFRAGERPVSITSPTQLPNLEVWYYADVNTTVGVTTGQEVTAWANAGGLTSHDWNSLGGSRPEWFSNIQNGKGVVRFNNTPAGTPTGEDADNNERLTINPVTYIQSLSGVTMAIAFRLLSTAAGTRYVTSTDKGGFAWGNNGTQWIGGFAGATFTVDTLTADTNFHYVLMNFDGSATGNTNRLKTRLDGSPCTLTFTGTVGATTAPDSAYFFGGCTGTGSANNATSNYLIGDIGEVLIWTRMLNAGEVLAVEDYISNKWGV